MMTTEQAAKAKICPMSISADGVPRNCRGAECMAWEWRYDDSPAGRKPTHEGYCGMSSKRS